MCFCYVMDPRRVQVLCVYVMSWIQGEYKCFKLCDLYAELEMLAFSLPSKISRRVFLHLLTSL